MALLTLTVHPSQHHDNPPGTFADGLLPYSVTALGGLLPPRPEDDTDPACPQSFYIKLEEGRSATGAWLRCVLLVLGEKNHSRDTGLIAELIPQPVAGMRTAITNPTPFTSV